MDAIARILFAGLLLAVLLACNRIAEPEPTLAPSAAPTATPAPLRHLHVKEPTDAKTLTAQIMESETLETVEIDPGMLTNTELRKLLSSIRYVTFDYAVELNGAYVPCDTAELSTEDAPLSAIADALPCLPHLTTVHLGASTPEAVAAARAALPGVALTYTLPLYGKDVAHDAETLDLSDVEPLTPDELAAALPYLVHLKTVSLGTREDRGVIELFRAAFPTLTCDAIYRFTYLGKTLTDDLEMLDLSNTPIPDLDAFREMLTKMPNLKRIEMIDCGLDDPTMGGLCDAFPDIKFVWEIDLGYWGKLRTDATAYSTRSRKTEIQVKRKLKDDTVQYIRYCTDLVALDLGHQSLTDISFLAPLKKLRVLILADSYISDISVLGELPELEYLELFMNRIEDVSPLAKLSNLHDLNICSNKVSDFTPLLSMQSLQRLWYARNNYTDEDHERLKEALPDCVLNHTSYDATSDGWRKTASGEITERESWKRAFFEGAPRFE